MAEFKLSYTANEINEKLGKVDKLVSTVNGATPDANGNIELASGGIVDVLELPTENINENAFYRLMTAKYIVNQEYEDKDFACRCVQTLPEIGEVCTDLNMSFIITYYSLTNNEAYGYVDSDLGTGLGIPANWYPVSALCEVAGITYSGIITDINDDPSDAALRLLLGYDFYTYKNEWMQVPFAYEKAPKFDITWDGDMTGKTVIDMSMLGYDAGTYFVKISDEVLSTDDVIGGRYKVYAPNMGEYYDYEVDEYDIDTSSFAGAFTIDNWVVVVHSEEELTAALGAPAGYITNGVYYLLSSDGAYLTRLTTSPRITKIDEKFLPDMSVDSLGLATVAVTGNYNDLYNKPSLSSYVTTSTLNSRLSSYVTSSQVDTKIAEAIGSAIGGSY